MTSEICPLLYGASLIALGKKDGGIRPIAIGNVFRRLVAKLACVSVRNAAGDILSPVQLGFGTKNGCEIIIHSVRSFLNLHANSQKVLLKIDYANAFNCIERDSLLCSIKEKIPQLYAFLWQAYRNESELFFKSDILSSCRGVQQDDPLGPLIFSLALHPIIEKLKSDLKLFYLDDGCLIGDPTTVLSDFIHIVEASKSIGLEINPNKCELFFCSNTDHAILSSFNAIAPGIKTVEKSDLSLLGSPIFHDAIELATKETLSKLTHLFENLQGLHPHIAFFLLKNCLAIPKLTYFLRTTPLWFLPSILKETDGLFKACLESILNLQLDDKSWSLASLPISFGGLGIRRLSDICIPAFLASAFGCSDFIKSQILNYGDESEIHLLSEALLHWNMLTDSQDPPLRLTVQKDWDHIISSKLYNSLMSTCSTPSDKARLLAIKLKRLKHGLLLYHLRTLVP